MNLKTIGVIILKNRSLGVQVRAYRPWRHCFLSLWLQLRLRRISSRVKLFRYAAFCWLIDLA